MKKLVLSLTQDQAVRTNRVGKWSIKELIVHLAAWNWEAINEVDRVLKNEATWPARYQGKSGENKFNRQEVDKRKNCTWRKTIADWEKSFWAQIEKMEQLTDKEWSYASRNQTWDDGTPVTVYSLFGYEYEGAGHEGGHAKQLKGFSKGKYNNF